MVYVRKNKPPIDWEAIEGEYRAGSKSVLSIAALYGVNHAAIHRYMAKRGIKRDLSKKIKVKVKSLTLADGDFQGKDDEIIDQAVNFQIHVIRFHRKIMNMSTAQAEAFMLELKALPKESSTLFARITAFRNLTLAAIASIEEERKICGISDEKVEDKLSDNLPTLDLMLKEIAAIGARLDATEMEQDLDAKTYPAFIPNGSGGKEKAYN